VIDDTAPVIPTSNYSALTLEIPIVTDLVLSEGLAKKKDGTIENIVEVWFNKPIVTDYQTKKFTKARIYYKSENATSYIFAGETTEDYFIINSGLNNLTTYEIIVISVDANGKENAVIDSPSDTILVRGKTAKPAQVQDFEVAQQGNVLRLSWSPNTEVDLSRYIIKKGSEWSTGIVIAEFIDSTEFLAYVGELGRQRYMIKAVDTSGNESLEVASDTIDVITPPSQFFLNEFHLWEHRINYKLSNCSLVWRNDFNSEYARPTICLDTVKSWEDLESEGLTWEELESQNKLTLDIPVISEGYFEMMEPYDLETIFNFTLLIDNSFIGETGEIVLFISTSTDNITYSEFATIDAEVAYRARYVKFKYLLRTTDTTKNIYLYDNTIYINVPNTLTDYGTDLLIPEEGITVTFSQAYYVAPRVSANIINGVLGFIKTTKTVDDVTFRVYADQAGTIPLGTAEIDWESRGY
jgi:hypothetical protein